MFTKYDSEEFREYALTHSPQEVATRFCISVNSVNQAYYRHNIKHFVPKRKGNLIHGYRHTAIYDTWRHIRSRCNNPRDKAYANYGGRGIKVCPEWQNNPKAFCEWALASGWQKGLSLDRIDNDKGYSPDNCRWTTRLVQNNNRRCTPHITYNGETHTLKEWASIRGIKYHTLYARYNVYGWSFEEAIELNKRKEK